MVPQTANAAEPPPVPPGATPGPFWAPEPGGSCCAPGARQAPCLPKHNRLLGEPSALAAGAQQPRRPHRAAPASPAVPEPGLGAGPGCPSADPLPAVYTRWRAIGNDRGSLGDQAQTALARAGLTAGSIAQPEEGESTRRKGGTAPLVRRAFQMWKKDVKPSCKTRIPPAAQNSLKPLLCLGYLRTGRKSHLPTTGWAAELEPHRRMALLISQLPLVVVAPNLLPAITRERSCSEYTAGCMKIRENESCVRKRGFYHNLCPGIAGNTQSMQNMGCI
nr:vasodilator-stimulated phosphoprotein isoform X2 [Zonotrichia albicollis]